MFYTIFLGGALKPIGNCTGDVFSVRRDLKFSNFYVLEIIKEFYRVFLIYPKAFVVQF